jgi:undecaprenyl-diphosphatase
MLKRYIKKVFLETVRDLTSLGNPLILIILSIFVLGINLTLFKIILGLIATEIFCTLIKILHYKNRPVKEKYKNIMEKINAGSFPSLHAARISFAFLTLFFIIPVYSIKIIALLMIVFIGVSRIILKKHYLSDVITGLLIGIIFSIIWMKFII